MRLSGNRQTPIFTGDVTVFGEQIREMALPFVLGNLPLDTVLQAEGAGSRESMKERAWYVLEIARWPVKLKRRQQDSKGGKAR